MTTVCDGNWSKHLQHPRVVLKDDGNADGQTSHGMCESCKLMTDAEMDGKTDRELIEYGAYLAGPFDPRD